MGQNASGTTTTSNAPPDFQKDFLENVFGEARNLFNANPEGPRFIQGFDPSETSAQEGILNFAGSPGLQGVSDRAITGIQKGLEFLDPNSQAIQDAIASVTNPIFTRLEEDILPGVREEGIATGNLGSTKNQLATAQAIERSTQAATAEGARIAMQGQQLGQGALSLAPNALQLGISPFTFEGAVGSQRRELAQNQAQERELGPYEALQQYMSIIGQNIGGQGQTNVNQPGGFLSWLFS